jgi:hypothetical protein
MHRTTSLLPRLLLCAIAVVVLVAGAGCADDDDTASAPPATTATQPAAPRGADALDASDTATLLSVRRTVTAYCANHKATAGELTGAIATLESLYQIDPDAKQPDGTTVEQAAVALERKLHACGARKAAKRLAKLTG